MTPSEIRALVEQANVSIGHSKEEKWLEGNRFTLALLCADLGEALRGVAMLEMHPDFSNTENEELRQRAVAARAALTSLEALAGP